MMLLPRFSLITPRFILQFTVFSTFILILYLSQSTTTPTSRLGSTTPTLLSSSISLNNDNDRVSTNPPWILENDGRGLPQCEKIFVFTFLNWWGFASEFILYIRAMSMAEKLGYTFLPLDENWNYGSLTNYFKPLSIPCVPPVDWNATKKAYPVGKGGKGWRFDKKGRERKRLKFSRIVGLGNLDDWTREEYFTTTSSSSLEEEEEDIEYGLKELKEEDERHRRLKDRWILEEGKTLPNVFRGVFEDQVRAVEKGWRLNEEMETEVEGLERQLRDGLEGQERGPVIGVHIRLGDKSTEYLHDSQEMGITNQFGNLTVYVEAAYDAYLRLISTSTLPSLSSSTSTHLYSPSSKPTLLIMTTEPNVSSRINEIPLSKKFRIVQTPLPVDIPITNSDAKAVGTSVGGGGGGPRAYSISTNSTDSNVNNLGGGGYLQSTFNSLSIETRVQHTKSFVRDLALLTKLVGYDRDVGDGEMRERGVVDALIVSGASNIGRLAMMIGGREAVTGPRDSNGNALGGRIRSVDAHFYPTSYPSSVYSHLEDLEDLENAARVPNSSGKSPGGGGGGGKARLKKESKRD